MDKACAATGVKYIVFCEGDDYWIDPLKLQRQADIMEKIFQYLWYTAYFIQLMQIIKL